jgi:hypothetical protein
VGELWVIFVMPGHLKEEYFHWPGSVKLNEQVMLKVNKKMAQIKAGTEQNS